MVSGGGRTLLNLADRIDDGTLPATVALVISSRPDCPAVGRAAHRGFDVRVAAAADFPDEARMHDAITAWLREREVDVVCLCGYLRWFRLEEPFASCTMNIHPALLPKFAGRGMYGLRVHRAVLDSRAQQSGCSVHFVDDQYDHGPIILQRTCRVLPDDDAQRLAARVFEQECLAYPEAIRLFAARRLQRVDGRVHILTGST